MIDELKAILPKIDTCVTGMKKAGKELKGPCPKCGGTDRFWITQDNKFGCRGCHEKYGDVIEFHQWMYGGTIQDLARQYLNQTKLPKARAIPANLAATYSYTNHAGNYLFQVERYEEKGCEKQFRQWVERDGEKITPTKAGVKYVPYNLPGIYDKDEVVIVEGEKDVDRLVLEGVTATTTPGGGKNFKAEYAEFFRGKHLIIIPDQDETGTTYKKDILKHCLGVAASIKVVDLPRGKDVSEFLDMGGTVGQIRQMVIHAPLEMPGQADDGVKIPDGINAADLLKKVFPDPRWAVKGVLPEGLTILGGKPKAGKSILALNLCLQIALGGRAMQVIQVERGTTIYLALEDVQRRLKDRIGRMLEFDPAPDNLLLFTEWPRLGEGGARALDKILADNPDTRLLAIDTLAKIRPPQKGNGNLYSDDYAVIDALKRIADKHEVSVLIVHHLRKMEGDDVFDTFSGTLGLTGAADGLMVMRRNNTGQMILSLRGRDVEEQEYVLEFDPWMFGWKIAGRAVDVKSTDEKQILFDCLKDAGKPMTPKEIAEVTGLDHQYVRKNLPKMCEEGALKKEGYGKYTYIYKGNSDNSGNSCNTGNSGNSCESVADTCPSVAGGDSDRQQFKACNDGAFNGSVASVASVPGPCGNSCKYADLEKMVCLFELITGGDDEPIPFEQAAASCPAGKGVK